MFLGDDPRDHSPVVSVEISYDPNSRVWQIFYYLANGQMMSRAQQYAITDSSAEGLNEWEGPLPKDYTYENSRQAGGGGGGGGM
jgi:hypothetical protein